MGILDDLIEDIKKGNAVLFVGAGLSVGAGLPNWSELVTPLADQIGLQEDERGDPLQVAQDYELERGRQALVQYILEKTKTTTTGPTENHGHLAHLGIGTWVTTNYDDLLESTLKKYEKDYDKVVLDQNLPFASADRVTLIKLHGDRDVPNSIVITERDYNTYFRDSPRIQEHLNALLVGKTFLFVGYSISDPDFKQIRDGIAYDLGENQRLSYAVLFNADERWVKRLGARKIQVINVEMQEGDDPNVRLGEWLKELVKCVNPSPLEPLSGPSPDPSSAPSVLVDRLLKRPDGFTGREKELAELEKLLEPDNRAVLLHGRKGFGKTFLAREFAYRLARKYPTAQLRLDLQEGGKRLSVDDIRRRVIRSVDPNVRLPNDEQELRAQYNFTLSRKKGVLLLLENAADKDQVVPLLPPEDCAMVITSRERLSFLGSHPFRVSKLLPEDAVALLQRLSARIDREDALQMAEKLDYMPFALSLAGSQLAEREDLDVKDYLRALDNAEGRLELAEPVLEFGYCHLEPELQMRWLALAVFPGGFDQAGAGAVWSVGKKIADASLGRLLKADMVEWDGVQKRYRMQTLAHDFASARLEDQARSESRERLAKHYVEVLHEANECYKQGREAARAALQRFDLDWPNIEAGQQWASEHAKRSGKAKELCGKYGLAGTYLLSLRLEPDKRISWYEAAIGESSVFSRLGDKSQRADLVGNLGNALREHGEVDEAIRRYKEALKLAEGSGNPEKVSYWQGRLGNAYIVKARQLEEDRERDLTGDEARLLLSMAVDECKEALEIAHEAELREREGSHLGNLGYAYLRQGDTSGAISRFEQALKIFCDAGDRRGTSIVLGHLGRAYLKLDMVDEAVEHYERALAIDEEIGDLWNQARHKWGLGEVYESTGDLQRAVDLMSVRVAYECEIGHKQADHHAEYLEKLREQIDP